MPPYPPTPGAPPPPGWGFAGPPEPLSPGGQPLAGFDKRLVAYLLDALILGAVCLAVMLPIYFCVFLLVLQPIVTINGEVVDGATPAQAFLVALAAWALALVLGVVISYVYHVEIPLRTGGQTYGKRIMKIQIAPLNPAETLARRHLGLRFLVAAGMGYLGVALLDGLWQLWDKPYQQCLHDKAAKTVVVRLTP